MVDVSFTFTPPTIPHAKVPQAIARGLNEAGDRVRTQVVRKLKVHTNVKVLRSINSRVRTVRAYPGSLSYEIVAKAKPIPLTEFPMSVTSRGIDAKTWGVDHLFKRSFGLDGRFVARTGSQRFPIRRLLGPSVAKELHSGPVMETFENATAEFVAPIVLKHIIRAIG